VIPTVKRKYVTWASTHYWYSQQHLYTFYLPHLGVPEKRQEIDGAGGNHMINTTRFV
jgi:hypothetical protein